MGPISSVPADDDDSDLELDLGQALGADQVPSHQVLRVYIPDRDRDGQEIGDQRRWVLLAASLLARIGGGVTIEPPVEGGWLDPRTGRVLWEHPVLVYTYVEPERFAESLPELRTFLHQLGRDTHQGEIAFEFDGVFYRVGSYDPP
jgi:hypothetical protein